MNRVLILYGTTDGHTRKIAEVLAKALRGEGCAVDLCDAAAGPPCLTVDGYDGILVAASVHIGDYQRPVKRWVRANAGVLNAVPSAFVTVCLAILEHRPETDRALRAIEQRFLHRTGWRPSVTIMIAGAVPYTRYGLVKRWMMKRKMRQAGGGTDTSRDYEYTDWAELSRFAREFSRGLLMRSSSWLAVETGRFAS